MDMDITLMQGAEALKLISTVGSLVAISSAEIIIGQVVAVASQWAALAIDQPFVGKPEVYGLKAIQDPQGKSRGRGCRYPSPGKTFTPSGMVGRDCAFTPQGLQFSSLKLSSMHAQATSMVEKNWLCRKVDIDWHNDVWHPKHIFWMLWGQISPFPRSTWILFWIS